MKLQLSMPLLLTVLAGIAFSQSATEPTTQPDISALISKLGDDDPHVRDQAQADLVSVGPAAESALHAVAENSTDDDIRARATAIIQQIDAGGGVGATLITLHVSNADPSAVLAAISKQSPVPVQFWQGRMQPLRPVTLDLDGVPFWQAIDQFCAQTSTQPQMGGSPGDGITLSQGRMRGHLGGICDQQGRFSVVAVRTVSNRSVDLGDGTAHNDCHVELMVYFDPKLKIMNHGQPQVDKADDEAGNSWLMPDSNQQMYGGGNAGAYMFSVPIMLHAPPNPGQKLTLKGSTPVEISKRTEPLHIDDLSKDIDTLHTIGHRTLLLTKCDFANGQCQVGLTLTATDAAPTSPGHVLEGRGFRTYSGAPPLYEEAMRIQFLDQNGHRLEGGSGGSGHGNVEDVTYNFNATGPISLNWEVVTESESVNIPFEFKDLGL